MRNDCMKKKYVEPEIIKIELKMTENIATSLKEEETDVPGFKMRQLEGTPGGCQEFYIKTSHSVVNEFTLMDIYYGKCITVGSKEEQAALMMLRP